MFVAMDTLKHGNTKNFEPQQEFQTSTNTNKYLQTILNIYQKLQTPATSHIEL